MESQYSDEEMQSDKFFQEALSDQKSRQSLAR